jgi:hypothetical protein
LPPVDELRPSHLSPNPDLHKHASHKHASPCPRGRRRAAGPWTGRKWRLACLACTAPVSTWSAHRVEQSTLVGAAQRATRRCNRRRRGLRQTCRSTHRRTTSATPTLIRTPLASSCKSKRPYTVRLDTCGVPRAPTPPPQPSPLAHPPTPAPTPTHPARPPGSPAQSTTSLPPSRISFRAQVQCCGKGGASTNQPSFESGAGRTDLLRSLEAPATDWDERSQGRERTDAGEV